MEAGDYHRLNNVTIPLPNIANFTSRIAGSTVFSRLDLQKCYNQFLMASEDVPKTSIVMPFQMFEFLHLPLVHELLVAYSSVCHFWFLLILRMQLQMPCLDLTIKPLPLFQSLTPFFSATSLDLSAWGIFPLSCPPGFMPFCSVHALQSFSLSVVSFHFLKSGWTLAF